MTRRAATLLAWGLWSAAAVAIAAAVVLASASPPAGGEPYDPVDGVLWSASWLGFGLVGALILSRRPDSRIGWLLSAITAAVAAALLAPAYARYAAVVGGTVPLGSLAAWGAAWTGVPALGLVVLLVLLFPTGTLDRRSQRVLAAALAFVVAADTLVYALRPGPVEGSAPPVNPLGVEELAAPLSRAAELLGHLFSLVALLVVVEALLRFRRSRGVQRQQFRWFAWAAAAFPVLFFAVGVAEETVLGYDGFDPTPVVFFVSGNALAVAIGVAVTRHGLYEIDRVISRTLGWALLTLVLGAAYLLTVTALTAVTAPVTGNSPLAVAAATLVAAALFGPARRHIQRAVDRRFDRTRYDAARTVEEYRDLLRDQLDLNALCAGLVGAAQRTVQPASAQLWLRPPAVRR